MNTKETWEDLMKTQLIQKNLKRLLSSLKEYLILIGINLKVQFWNFIEFLKVAYFYYPKWKFAKIDVSLISTYLFNNPYILSKKFLQKRGETDIHIYGETPLTTLDKIAKECRIQASDYVFELGCGRGRNCFWLNSFIGCHVVGIEQISQFVEKANLIKNRFHLNKVQFRHEDMLNTRLTDATVIYLYGTCLDEATINALIDKFKTLPSGTKIITISYPLTDYPHSQDFEIMKRFPASFTWGEGDVYLQIRK